MLTQRFKIELCRPVGACIMSDSLLRRVAPYADLCRPFGACILIMNLGQLVYHYLFFSLTYNFRIILDSFITQNKITIYIIWSNTFVFHA